MSTKETVSHSRARTNLRTQIVSVSALSETQTTRMFDIMRKYYDEVSHEQFLCDLSKKDQVILLLDDEERNIQGFSTLVTVTVKQKGIEYEGVFSGDTVIEKAFWGQRALGKAFLRYLFSKKVKRPFQPLYWLLISKGYKTYLMMANNFREYYPRYDEATPPERKGLMEAFYAKLYPNEFDATLGLIKPTSEACHLKSGVAGISEDLLAENPKIAFFQAANPDWNKGVELACLARMTVWMPLRYALKALVVDFVLQPLRSFQLSVFSSPLKRENKKR